LITLASMVACNQCGVAHTPEGWRHRQNQIPVARLAAIAGTPQVEEKPSPSLQCDMFHV
jgi:hypothetical protein